MDTREAIRRTFMGLYARERMDRITVKGFVPLEGSSWYYEAFREAMANALAHHTWDVPANVTVSMFPDRIEVVSPGSLPPGLTEEDYLSGHVSMLRNPTLAGVFFRLDWVRGRARGIVAPRKERCRGEN